MSRTMPRCHFLRHLFFLLLLLTTSYCAGAAAESSNQISLFGFRPAGRLLLHSPEPNTELVVDRSGKVSLIVQPSEKPIWSFSSGTPIHSSYQAPIIAGNNNTDNATEISKAFVVEYVDNSQANTVDDDLYTRRTMEDLLKMMPLVSDDGVTLGSKTSTAYLIDGISGRLIHIYRSTDSPGDSNHSNAMVKPTSSDNFVKLPLLITRTDSKLEHFDKITRKILWNVTVSDFGADLLCDLAFNAGNNLGPEILTGVYMPLRCGSKTKVRANIKSEFLIRVPRDPSQELTDSEISISLPSTRTRESRKLQEQDRQNYTGKFFGWSPVRLLVPLFFLGAVVSVFIKRSSPRSGDLSSNSGPSRKKKNRSKSGKGGIINGQSDKQPEFELIEGGQMLSGFNNLRNGAADGRTIGKLFVSNKEIAKGSNGTVVFEGLYQGRPVAVKRLVRSHHQVASKEIENLIASDQHSNIVRWYGVEYDQDFADIDLDCGFDEETSISEHESIDREETSVRSKFLESAKLGASRVLETLQQDDSGFNTKSALDELNVRVSGLLVREVLVGILRNLGCDNNTRCAKVAYRFFVWSKEQECFRHTVNSYHLLMKIFAECGEYKAMWRLVDEMVQDGYPTTARTFNLLICSCGEAGLAKQAVVQFMKSKAFNYRPFKHSYNAILNSLLGVKQYTLIEWVYEQMLEDGFSPDVLTYNVLMWTNYRLGKMDRFDRLFDEMARDGVSPDLYTYNILLHILGKGNKPLAALTTLNHMKEVGIDPSVIHFTSLIDGLSRAGNLEACKYFLDEMVRVGCRPDVVCYTVMITGYVVSGELEKAKEMFREMTIQGQLPNVFTYNSMIRGLCMAGEFREACWLLKEMESRGCNPNFVVYSTLVSYLRKAGKLSEARKVIRDMVKKGHYVHLVPKMMKYRR